MKKIFFSDYDGTLHQKDSNVMNLNRTVINKFRDDNNLFCVATGRTYIDIRMHLERKKIGYDYIVASDGSVVFDSFGNKLYSLNIENKFVRELYNILENIDGIQYFGVTDGDSLYIKKIGKYSFKDFLALASIKFVFGKHLKGNINYFYYHNSISQILVKASNEDALEQIRMVIKETYAGKLRMEVIGPFISIVHESANKTKGIEYITNKLNMESENVYVIGDNNNDIQMIKKYNGYAVENSIKEVKEIASHTFKTVADAITYIWQKR